MFPPNKADSGPSNGSSNFEPDRKGSVKRARQLLEAGVRPAQETSQAPGPPPVPSALSSAKKVAHQTQWPLPASGLQPRPLNPHQPRFMAPSGPPPLRPPRPSEVPSQIPSPSIYSVRSGESPEPSFSSNYPNPYPYPTPSIRSFSHPNPRHQQQQQQPRPLINNGTNSPTSTVDMSSRISVGTDELFRNSTHSNLSIPSMPPGRPSEPPIPPVQPRRPTAGLHIPPSARRSRARKSSVSPIPEEIPNPRQTLGSYASSRAIPSSWGSGPAESEILGAYLDDGSSDDDDGDDEAEASKQDNTEDETNLVRSASVGKRHKPTMRTIMKSNPNSEVSIPDLPGSPVSHQDLSRDKATGLTMPPAAAGKPIVTENGEYISIRTPSPVCRGSISSLSGESYVDPEKPRFARYEERNTYRGALEKEIEALPRAAPTMSDKRPNGRKPPHLDMEAVRGAEARGSLSSLTDLIRRATKLASNLDRGKTSSRADLAGVGADFRDQGHRGRNSGSLSDILASFPNPTVATPDTRSSWPVFFGRSNLRNVEPLASHDDVPQDPPPQRRCCGMPRRWFIALCILIFIIVALAILLPVFLVAVPRENASRSCSHTTPCHNGGVSVSGGTECSCVCAEGYTGSQCTVEGDSSCVTAEVDNGSINQNATMGSSIPTLLDQSQSKFGIDLDGVTIMALFSMNNISCRTENALVSFNEVDQSGNSKTARRSVVLPGEGEANSIIQDQEMPMITRPSPSPSVDVTPVSKAVEPRSLATSNGIYYESGATSSDALAASTEDDSTATTTSTTASSQSTATATKTGSASESASATATVPSEVIDFSRVAVLYILEKTGSFNSAQESETQIQTYLIDSYDTAAHPAVKVLGWYSLDFENKTISTG